MQIIHPLISIIIPTYNRAHIIGETLDSIIAQTYTNWECIVVDDGSSDNSAEVMAKYIAKDSRFRYYNRPKDRLKGPCSCRNFGFERSKGDFINFFDSDDLLMLEALEKALSCFNVEVDAVIMNAVLTDFKTGKQNRINKNKSSNMLTDYFIGNITFLVCGPLWKKSFLAKQPYLFDEELGHGDDWDFNLRMLYSNPKLFFCDDILINYRLHLDSLSKEVGRLNKAEILSDFQAREKHYSLIKKRNDVNLEVVEQFIVSRYKIYLKWAILQKTNSDLLWFLAKSLVMKQIKFYNYLGAIKSCFGYLIVLISGRGYSFFKN